MTDKTAHQRVVRDYFRTTSVFSSAMSQAAFDVSVLGLRRRLRRWLDVRNLDVLDLGSGTGELCRLVEVEGAASVIGINLSADEIEFARAHAKAIFIEQDVASYLASCPPSSVDRIFALNILEHLDRDTLFRVMEDSFRVLRESGQLVVMVPNATSPFGGMTRYWDITHNHAFTLSSMRQLGRIGGFGEQVEFRECGPVPYGVVSGIRYVLWQFVRLAIKSYLMIELASSKGGIYTADLLARFTKRVGTEQGPQ